MSKLLIDKEKLEVRIAELDKNLNKWAKAQSEGNYALLASEIANLKESKIELNTLQSILQQGEEYNENELTFLRTEVIRLMKENKTNMVIFEEEVNKIIADNEK